VSVRSEELRDSTPASQPAARSAERPAERARPAPRGVPASARAALALVLFVFGGIAWIAGGKYTIEGWAIVLNMFTRWIGLGTVLAVPRGLPLLGAIVGVGLVYSLVELLVWRASARRMAVFWVGWVPIVASDIWSTLVGVLAVSPSDPLLLRQVAALLPLAILWSLVLTFVPEWMIVGAWRLLRR
jgi:hypothetical protein